MASAKTKIIILVLMTLANLECAYSSGLTYSDMITCIRNCRTAYSAPYTICSSDQCTEEINTDIPYVLKGYGSSKIAACSRYAFAHFTEASQSVDWQWIGNDYRECWSTFEGELTSTEGEGLAGCILNCSEQRLVSTMSALILIILAMLAMI